MFSIYKNNGFPFLAVLVALLLCMPLMAFQSRAQVRPKPAPKAAVSDPDAAFTKAGLTDLARMNAGFVFNLRYATTDNFTHRKLYAQPRAFLRTKVALKLAAANRDFMKLGYRLKIYDAYRPYSVQKTLFAIVPDGDEAFIASPYRRGSNHNRGAAVDVTLVRLNGSAIPMPTDFDTFSDSADIYATDCSDAAIADRELLAQIMVKNGFLRLPCEWWHFDDPDAANYGLLDIPF